jgi:hypothetical protein
MMTLRFALSVLILAAVAAEPAHAQVAGVGRTIDEGAFVVTKTGAPSQTESFRITRGDNGAIQATGQVIAGDERINTRLTADSLGTPVAYRLIVKNHGSTSLDISARALGRRLTLTSTDSRRNESMKDFPITPGQFVILEDGLVHQLYFVPLGQRAGAVQVIEPRVARQEKLTLSGQGLEPVQIAGKSVTATHYSLVSGSTRREFWVDAGGRVLKVEVPQLGLVAVREELPR